MQILAGERLYTKALKTLLDCKEIDKVFLDTDSEEMYKLVDYLPIEFMKRDKKLASAFIFREDTFENPGEYKSSRIPSSGQRLKDADLGAEQTSFFD
jgi:hypothetical protein